MKKYKFYKETSGRWYIDLPEWTGAKEDLEMVSGADAMLDIMSEDSDKVEMYISTEEFEGADVLDFNSEAFELGDGAYYTLYYYKGINIHLTMWLCGVTKFVFGNFPEKIYISKISE